MVWLTDSEAIERMTDHVRGLGWNPDIWWRGGVALSDWWDAMGWPESNRTYLVAVPAGGCVAWISRVAGIDSAGLWTLYAYSLPLDVGSGEYTDIASAPRRLGQGHKLDDRFVTQWSIGKVASAPIRPAVVGDWCGCREDASGGGRIGQVREIDAKGRIVMVQLDRHGTQGRACDYSRKWFALGNRHEACVARWTAGQTVWKAYIAMLAGLAREQKRALGIGKGGKLVRDDRPTTAPAHAPGSVAPAGYRAPVTPTVGFKSSAPMPGAPPNTPTGNYAMAPAEAALYEEAETRNETFRNDTSLSDEDYGVKSAQVDAWRDAELRRLGFLV